MKTSAIFLALFAAGAAAGAPVLFAAGPAATPADSKRAQNTEVHQQIVDLDKAYRDLAVQRRDPSLTDDQKKAIVEKMKANREERKAQVMQLWGINNVLGKPSVTNVAPSSGTAVASPAPAGERPDPNKGLFRDAAHGFSARAPQGWVLDTQKGLSNGLPAVFFPEGSSWSRADVVMYVNPFNKADVGDPTLAGFIAGDKAEAARRDTGLKVKEHLVLPTADGRMATVVEYQSDNRHDAIAYLEEKGAFVTLVVSAKNPGALALVRPVFGQLVGSYRHLAVAAK